MENPKNYFSRIGVNWRNQTTSGYEIDFDCPACSGILKAAINVDSWLWKCFVCGVKGNEISLKRLHGTLETEKIDSRFTAIRKPKPVTPPTPVKASSALPALASAYLASRAISAHTGALAGLEWSPTLREGGGAPDNGVGWLIFKYRYPGESEPYLIKGRICGEGFKRPDGKLKRYSRTKGGESKPWFPFGFPGSETHIICAGEFDLLSWVEMGFDSVSCIPDGEDSWNQKWNEYYSSCDDIVIAFDNDKTGKEGAEKLSNSLGQNRSRIVSWPEGIKDSNDFLREIHISNNEGIGEIVNSAKSKISDGIKDPFDLYEDFMNLIQRNKAASEGLRTPWKALDSLIGGERPGEITVVTGNTGSGKTTILGQLCLHRLKDNPVFFMPFEMGAARQIEKFIWQMMEGSPSEDISEAAIQFHNLCGTGLKIYDSREVIEVEKLRQNIMYAVTRFGCKTIFIDHLHWICPDGPKQLEKINAVLLALSEIAEKLLCHIYLVVHPQKTKHNKDEEGRDNAKIEFSDLKGSSSIYQVADNIISLWRPRDNERRDVLDQFGNGTTVVYVMKARHNSASEGSAALRFDPVSTKMFDIDQMPKVKVRIEKWRKDVEED